MILPPVDRVSVTTVVDNSVDILRPDEKVARRSSVGRARKRMGRELVVSSTGSTFTFGG
jgi:hypothetical protein